MDNTQNNQKSNNPKSNNQRRSSDIELVVVATKKLENRFVADLGASKYSADGSNAGFFEKLRQVEHLFNSEDLERFKYISMVRNIIVHDPHENRLNDRHKFENTISLLNAAFETAKQRQATMANNRNQVSNTHTQTTPQRKPKSGCFIATAVYGNYDHSQVMVLRQFRDTQLLSNNLGKIFVKTYYFVSPPIADFLQKHQTMAKPIKVLLDKIVKWVS